jgi:hypothetical protein
MRGARRPLREAGFETREFYIAKETYAAEFEEYFKVARLSQALKALSGPSRVGD